MVYVIKYKILKGMLVGIYIVFKVLYVVIMIYDDKVFEFDVLINNFIDLIIKVMLDVCWVVDLIENKMVLIVGNKNINLDNEIWVGNVWINNKDIVGIKIN